MATDAPFGFRPLRGHSSEDIMSCVIPATDGTATFIGDLVTLHGAEDTTDAMPTVIQAAAGGVILGSIVGFEPDYTDLTAKHRTASTKRICRVCRAMPYITWEAQCDAAVTASDSHLLYNVVVAAGDTTTGRSAMELDIGTASNTDGQLLLIGPSKTTGEDFDTAAAGTIVEIHINESVYKVYGTTAISPGVA